MKKISYRQITNKNDIEVLRNKESHYKNFSYAYNSETIDLLKKNFERANSLYVIATQGDAFAGFVSCDTDWWEEGGFFIREIFVNPAFQRQKIGETLMGMCIDHSKKNRAKYVVTQTAYENIRMQKLCEKFDFKRWDNPQWEEGITYKLTLGY